MRIVNVLPDPRHYSYASTASGGKTLKSGEESPELPLERIHTPALWKDIGSGKAQIRLSAEDRKLIKRYLFEGGRKIVVQTRPEPVKPKKIKKPKVNKLDARKPKPVTSSKRPRINPVTAEALKKGKISLHDLQATNSAGAPAIDNNKKASLSDIEKHIGSRV